MVPEKPSPSRVSAESTRALAMPKSRLKPLSPCGSRSSTFEASLSRGGTMPTECARPRPAPRRE